MQAVLLYYGTQDLQGEFSIWTPGWDPSFKGDHAVSLEAWAPGRRRDRQAQGTLCREWVL